jgi:hypothetical protein
MTSATEHSCISLASVRDMDAAAWDVTLTFGHCNREPMVALHREKPFAVRHPYCLSTLVDCVICGRPFYFGDYGRESTTHRLSPLAVLQVVTEAVRRIPGTVGRLHGHWVPNDPSVPF